MTSPAEKTAEPTQDGYAKWRARLAGEKVLTFPQPDEEDIGWYRKPITEPRVNAKTGQRNGKTIVVGWEPVEYFMDFGDSVLRGRIGNREMTSNEVVDNWTWCCRYPISEEWYRDAAELGKPWPDAKAGLVQIPAADRDVTATDNTQAEEIAPDKAHAAAVDAAIGAALKTVTSTAEDAQANGSKNRIAELRLAADKAGKAIYEPIYRQYTAEQKKWSPIIARATAEEKRLNTEILKFRESERQRIAKEQAEADRKQRELDEANARAADRAIARGEPEPEPEVVEAAPVIAAAPIAPTYGTRVIKEQVKTFLYEVEDFDLVYNFFKVQSRGQVETFLKDLAERAIKAGFEVPGTKTRKGLI
jgi:hypothetical protein